MPQATPQPYRRLPVALAKIAAVVLCLLAINHGIEQLKALLDFDIRPSNEDMVHLTIMFAAVLYTLALAIPFVPGVEIGLGLMAILGVMIVPLVYLCTVSGLFLAYLIGRLIPARVLVRLAHDVHLDRMSALLSTFDAVPKSEKMSFLLARAPGGIAAHVLRFRYVAIAIALNVPGNFVLGGGGGIAMMAGISRLFGPGWFLATVALAVSPVPVLVMLIGPTFLAD